MGALIAPAEKETSLLCSSDELIDISKFVVDSERKKGGALLKPKGTDSNGTSLSGP